MSVGSFINGGTGFLRTHLRLVAIWCVIYFFGAILLMSGMRPMYAGLADFQRQMALRRAMGTPGTAPFPVAGFGNFMLLELLAMLLMLVAFAAVVRAAARTGADRFAFLRLGMDEVRLVGLAIVLGVITLVVEVVGVVAMVAIGAGLGAAAGKGVGGTVAVLLGLVLFCAAVFAQVRLSLAGVLTVIRGRIVIGDAWRVTRGHFWSLFLFYLVWGLIYLIFAGIIMAISTPGLLASYASMNPQAIQAASQARMAQEAGFSTMFLVQMVLGAIVFVPCGVVLIAGMTSAAMDLGGLNNIVAREFD